MAQTKEDPIASKIDQILRILAVIATKGMNQRQQIAVLHQAGLQPREIADLLGTTGNTVRVELVALRKSKGKKSKRTE